VLVRVLQIGEEEWLPIVVGLARTGPIAWLDGDGTAALGARSFVGLGPAAPVAFDAWAPLARMLDAGPTEAHEDPLARACPRTTLALSYDLGWAMPIGLRAPRRHAAAPLLAFAQRHDAVLALDHVERRALLVADDPHTLARAEARLEAARATHPAPRARLGAIDVEPADLHRAAIDAVLGSIGEGDLYQANLARRFHARFDGDPLALALAMRVASPVPLGVFLPGPDGLVLVARTMERFVSVDAATRAIETRPIKGTRRHDGTVAGLADARASLLADEKERAEHAMIVDLMRNDLSRVARAGSVRVREAFCVEPYARLSHLVSIVDGRVREGVPLSAVLEATFPPGSVTGTPKLAAMEHIERLERYARGFYTGALGAIARDGSLSLAVAIRTAAVHAGRLTYFAGGGIVEASDPVRETDETELKARVLADASAILAAASRESNEAG
jgi:anthranilate/para-aminobenzoate synthase component I